MEKLYLGVAREVITPALGVQLYGYRPPAIATSVEDDLTVTVFYFKQGDTQALMMTATVCLINTGLAGQIRAVIEEKFGIPKQNCMISATHTHSGPNVNNNLGWGDMDTEYVDHIFLPAILKAAETAVTNPAAVTVGAASGNSYVGMNRREILQDNSITLGQNPWGPFDPRMTVVSFKNDAGAVVANLIHYGCHCTSAGRNNQITRDWAGIMTDELEKYSGAITAFFNGAEGDVGPRLSNGKTIGGWNDADMHYVYELGHVAAQDAVRIYKEVYDYCDVQLCADGGDVDVPVKPRISLEEAQALREENKDANGGEKSTKLMYALKVIDAYKEGKPEVEAMPIQQSVLALGNLVFVSFPYELFSEIAMRIDGCFKDKRILSLSDTNGSEGYFITEDAICRGGYELIMFRYGQEQAYCDNADFALMQNTVKNIKKVLN